MEEGNSGSAPGKARRLRVIIAAIYYFNGDKKKFCEFPEEINEVQKVIESVNSSKAKTKVSKEKTMRGKELYSPEELNLSFKKAFEEKGWTSRRVHCEYSTKYYVKGFEPSNQISGAFREIDFVKKRVGVEVQFGKYAFMFYNVCAKMTIFHKSGIIDIGVEIVPIKTFADEMSTGVSYFEQLVWDLEQRGVADIDIPVLILGVTGEVEGYMSPPLCTQDDTQIVT
jgi:hypothetical protein